MYNLEIIMDVRKVFLVLQGWNAAGLARSVACQQLSFDYNRALNKALKKDTAPVYDAHKDDEYAAYAGMDKAPEPKPLDKEDLMNGHAAAWVLARRHIWRPSPETGRVLEHQKKYVIALPNAVVLNVENLTARNIETAKADAARMPHPVTGEIPDISARIAAIKAENTRLADELYAEVAEPYKALLGKYGEYDDEALVEIVLDALADAGRNVAAEVTRAADAQLEAARKRMLEGKFARIEPDIYALTSIGQRGGKPLPA